MAQAHPIPSEQAGDLVRGADDLHVHVAPDVRRRWSPPAGCWTTAFTGKDPWPRMVENTRRTGPDHSLIANDLGQPTNPPVGDGLALMADALIGTGFRAEDVAAIVGNSRRLALP